MTNTETTQGTEDFTLIQEDCIQFTIDEDNYVLYEKNSKDWIWCGSDESGEFEYRFDFEHIPQESGITKEMMENWKSQLNNAK